MRQNHTVEPATLSPETDRAVARLTQPHTVVHDGHAVEWPPLLEWISDAVTDKTKRGGAGSGGTGSPINEGALAVLQHIERGTAQLRGWLYLTPRAGGTNVDLIEAWQVACDYRAKNELDDAGWEYVTSRLQTWVGDIEGEWEDRVHRMELTVACPRCGERWILEQSTDPHDEPKRRSAVVIEYAEGGAPSPSAAPPTATRSGPAGQPCTPSASRSARSATKQSSPHAASPSTSPRPPRATRRIRTPVANLCSVWLYWRGSGRTLETPRISPRASCAGGFFMPSSHLIARNTPRGRCR